MIDINLFNIIGIAYLGNMIAYDFTPIQTSKKKFINYIPFISSHVGKLLNCSKCCSFWLGFVLYQNIIYAAVTGLMGYLIHHLIDRIKTWYE